MTILIATLSGAIGAVARYGLTGVVQRRSRSGFPVGTMTVNLLGALTLGMVAGAGGLDSSLAMFLTGFLSGFTTFSTWMMETVWLGVAGGSRRALVNLTLTLVAGVALAALGYTLFS